MAEEIRVAGNVWGNLSEDERARITRIVGSAGLMRGGVEIVPDPSVQQPEAGAEQGEELFGWLCRAGCGIAETAAVAACAALSGPAIAICVAVAHAGGTLCRNRC
jgi:hypothetical protein